MNRRVVRDYFISAIDAKEIWKTDLFDDYIDLFNKLFGPRLHTVLDSSRRRISVWYVDQPDWPCPFWITSHRHRGTDYEIARTTTDEQCLALVKKLGEVLRDR